jgi:hypothetical protein
MKVVSHVRRGLCRFANVAPDPGDLRTQEELRGRLRAFHSIRCPWRTGAVVAVIYVRQARAGHVAVGRHVSLVRTAPGRHARPKSLIAFHPLMDAGQL